MLVCGHERKVVGQCGRGDPEVVAWAPTGARAKLAVAGGNVAVDRYCRSFGQHGCQQRYSAGAGGLVRRDQDTRLARRL